MSKDDQTAVATLSLCCNIVRSGWRPPAEMHTMRCRKRHGGELGDTYYLSDSGLMMDEDGTMRTREEAPMSDKKPGTWPQECVQRAFVEGAVWRQFKLMEWTAFASEREEMEAEAVRRYGVPT